MLSTDMVAFERGSAGQLTPERLADAGFLQQPDQFGAVVERRRANAARPGARESASRRVDSGQGGSDNDGDNELAASQNCSAGGNMAIDTLMRRAARQKPSTKTAGYAEEEIRWTASVKACIGRVVRSRAPAPCPDSRDPTLRRHRVTPCKAMPGRTQTVHG